MSYKYSCPNTEIVVKAGRIDTYQGSSQCVASLQEQTWSLLAFESLRSCRTSFQAQNRWLRTWDTHGGTRRLLHGQRASLVGRRYPWGFLEGTSTIACGPWSMCSRQMCLTKTRRKTNISASANRTRPLSRRYPVVPGHT